MARESWHNPEELPTDENRSEFVPLTVEMREAGGKYIFSFETDDDAKASLYRAVTESVLSGFGTARELPNGSWELAGLQDKRQAEEINTAITDVARQLYEDEMRGEAA
jgi:hypothetical protein